ncbi:MAG: hypothetical protein M3Z25_12945 [Actinomycetota bacterium]|nr:hypothetical protein [Actinomycetota bacterium]
MWLGVPGKIVDVWDEPSGARMAHGVHAGFALTATALVTISTVSDYGIFGEEQVVPS